MLEFIEIPPEEEFERLKDRAISLIRQETKESILEWLHYDNERTLSEMSENLVAGKFVIIISPFVTSEVTIIPQTPVTTSNKNDFTLLSIAA